METASKRERLVEAAKEVFYQQGVACSTLADIAQQAEVPLGNVYYYFRTKDALLEAVLEAHVQDLRALFAQWERNPDPRQRLLLLLPRGRDEQERLIRYGCPYGSLCQELEKSDSQLVPLVARLWRIYLDWARAQFCLLGKGQQEAEDLALSLIASLQGAFLLSSSMRSPDVLERQLQHLETWLRAL